MKAFLLCALFSLAIVPPAWSANADQPIPVAVLDTFNCKTPQELPPPAGYDFSCVGVFTSIIGTEVVTGTSRMDVKRGPAGSGIVYCRFTWVSLVGTLVVDSVCVIPNGHGTWHVNVKRSTGRYEHFKAVGTQTFGPRISTITNPYTQYERFAGITISEEHGGDENSEHGGNE